MEMIKYKCKNGHNFEKPCVDSIPGTPRYSCPECGCEEYQKAPVFPNLKNPITVPDELAREFVE